MDKLEIKMIQDFIRSKSSYISQAKKLYDIFAGDLTTQLKERLRLDFVSDTSYKEALSRLSVINICPKVVNKLSKVYSQTYCLVKNERNQEELDQLMFDLQWEETRIKINKLLNLHQCVAFEPIYHELTESVFVRVLAAHQFLVYSNDSINPSRVTHFIKILDAETFAIYTDQEYVEIDIDGKVIQALPNEYGRIPFVYVTRSLDLMPKSFQDDIEMITLLPLLLTDANYALKYQAFSIIYTMNLEANNLELAPNTVWHLQSNGSEGDKPEIGHIKPTLSIDEVIKNITIQYALWLETKNLKSQNLTQNQSSVASISGVAKLIDDADANDDIEEQRKILNRAEEDFFELCGLKFNQPYLQETIVTFIPQSRMPELPSEKVDRIIKKYDAKLSTRIDAIKEANGFITDQEAIDYIAEIDAERKEDESVPVV
jgi:hypothetical protein